MSHPQSREGGRSGTQRVRLGIGTAMLSAHDRHPSAAFTKIDSGFPYIQKLTVALDLPILFVLTGHVGFATFGELPSLSLMGIIAVL